MRARYRPAFRTHPDSYPARICELLQAWAEARADRNRAAESVCDDPLRAIALICSWPVGRTQTRRLDSLARPWLLPESSGVRLTLRTNAFDRLGSLRANSRPGRSRPATTRF